MPPMDKAEPLDRVRAICLGLPDVTERLSHGEPTWFVRGKRTFVEYSNHHHGGRLAFNFAAAPGGQEILIAANPERFFRPPYSGTAGWVGLYLDVPVDWDEAAGLVAEAYQFVLAKLTAPRSASAR